MITERQQWSLHDLGSTYELDFQWSLRAEIDLTFGRYDYGGLFLRMPYRHEQGGEALNSEGQVNGEAEGKRARWVSCSMPIEGRTDNAGFVYMDHPNNTEHPVPWRVDGELGISPSRCIAGQWELGKGETQIYQYRILVFCGDMDPSYVNKNWRDFCIKTSMNKEWFLMRSVIIVHPSFDATWPWTADHFHTLWKAQGSTEFIRLAPNELKTLGELVPEPGSVTRLISLNVAVTSDCLRAFSSLKEAVITTNSYGGPIAEELMDILKDAGVTMYTHPSEGYWGQSVSEFGLALTLCGLRRIPQTHHEIITSLQPWNYEPENGVGTPKKRGEQFGDDPNFTNGTVEGKRVRIVGAGNIASRDASFVSMLGADVAAWDSFATEPSFHRSGAGKEWHLSQLIQDAEIFVPMLPLTEKTSGLITSEHIHSLPKGCLVVLVTRAEICDS